MRFSFLIVGLLFSMAGLSRADLTFTLNPAAQAAIPGAELLFSGVLTNTSTTDKLFLNDLQATLTGDAATHVVLKSNAFFANVPGILLPGEVYNGPLFRVRLGNSAPTANYSGMIAIQGGSSITATPDLASATITLLAKPFDQWRYQTFGSSANDPAAADTADWDHDGLKNLLEYALQLDAKAAYTSGLPKPVVLEDHLTLTYVPSAGDITYTVEASTNLTTWSTDEVEQITIANPTPPGSLTFRYKHPLSASGKVFLRLKMTRL